VHGRAGTPAGARAPRRPRLGGAGFLEHPDRQAILDAVVDRMMVAGENEPLDDDPIEAERLVVAESLPAFRAGPDVAGLAPYEDRDREARRIPLDVAAAVADHGQGRIDPLRRKGIEVQLVGESGGQAPGHLRAVAADEDRDARLLESLRL